jgi:hypothetical protein
MKGEIQQQERYTSTGRDGVYRDHRVQTEGRAPHSPFALIESCKKTAVMCDGSGTGLKWLVLGTVAQKWPLSSH